MVYKLLIISYIFAPGVLFKNCLKFGQFGGNCLHLALFIKKYIRATTKA